jgi:hypothetical protein
MLSLLWLECATVPNHVSVVQLSVPPLPQLLLLETLLAPHHRRCCKRQQRIQRSSGSVSKLQWGNFPMKDTAPNSAQRMRRTNDLHRSMMPQIGSAQLAFFRVIDRY